MLHADAIETPSIADELLTRDARIIKYMPKAEYLAKRSWVKSRFYDSLITLDDILSAAYLGLVKAVDGWKPEISTMATYAELRIRGEIADYLKEQDPFPRRVRTALKEQAAKLAEGQEVPNQLVPIVTVSLTVPPGSDALHHGENHASSDPSPEDLVTASQALRLVMLAIRRLPLVSATVLEMFFFEEKTFAEIATHLGIPRHKVQGIKERAVTALKDDPEMQALDGRIERSSGWVKGSASGIGSSWGMPLNNPGKARRAARAARSGSARIARQSARASAVTSADVLIATLRELGFTSLISALEQGIVTQSEFESLSGTDNLFAVAAA